MDETPSLRQLAQLIITHQFGIVRDAEGVATATMKIFGTLFTSLSFFLGEVGTVALIRRSLRLTGASFPWFLEMRLAKDRDVVNAIGACLCEQKTDEAEKASIVLLGSFLDLLGTFVGHELTRQIISQTWPDARMSPYQEGEA
ncbi:MAG: hypothetical protein ACXW34_01530 [Nitrospira sp.]